MNIRFHDLKKKFGNTTAVDIEDFNVNCGCVLGLVGNNGAGKTTLFRLLLDLIKADCGNVVISIDKADNLKIGDSSSNKQNDKNKVDETDGLNFENGNADLNEGVIVEIDTAKSEEWKTFTGAYIDEGFLIDFLTPEEYFQFIGTVNSLSEQETNVRLEYFSQFMNGEILDTKKLIRNFSAGNKQKIGIIAAMLSNPKLLVLDEPFNFLDPTSQNCLKHILKEYSAQGDKIILLSSHNLTHTIDISTRIALLEKGKIIKELQNIDGNASTELENYFNI
ncbi:MAG: ATP-binding cassette domain-containing protein [Prevotella sp.]|nr:ATP-binding cassette domain-containing protein [Prevotella sp.]